MGNVPLGALIDKLAKELPDEEGRGQHAQSEQIFLAIPLIDAR